MLRPLLTLGLAASVQAHGHITLPHARNNGTVDKAGGCEAMECMWFSQPTEIPGEPTLPDYARTQNVGVSSGPDDYSRAMPWRAPGSAPVIGSGCGAAGGGPLPLSNGGNAPAGYAQGADFLTIPATEPTVWQHGSVQEVAFAIFANHGGGYSWRLCKKGSSVTEECFGRGSLEFFGDQQWIRYAPFEQWGVTKVLPDIEMPAVRVSVGTHPRGSHWSRNPVPACLFCDQAECMRNHTSQKVGDAGWVAQQHCSQSCSGLNITGRTCPPGMTQFPEVLPGISGYYANTCLPAASNHGQASCDGLAGFEFSIVDKVVVPAALTAGEYYLSWRWDCEQSKQIWQNCADVRIV